MKPFLCVWLHIRKRLNLFDQRILCRRIDQSAKTSDRLTTLSDINLFKPFEFFAFKCLFMPNPFRRGSKCHLAVNRLHRGRRKGRSTNDYQDRNWHYNVST